MSRKAANGEGTAIKLKSGKWRAAIHVPLPSGDKIRKYHVTRTLHEANDWLTTMRADIKAGKPALISNLTFGDYVEKWLKKYGSISIRDSTKMNYLTYIKHVRRHRINKILLKNLSTDDLQNFIIFLMNDGQLDTDDKLSVKTIRNIINMIHKALEHAVGTQLIYYNPAKYVQLPKYAPPEIHVLTEDEINRFVQAMNGNPLQIALIIMFFCGLRLGECCALTHDDIKVKDGIYYLSISKSLNRVSNFDAKPGEAKTILRLSDVKSRKSKRMIPLLPDIAEIILKHMESQREQAKASYGLYEEKPFLVSNELGHFLDPSTVRNKLKAVASDIGIEGFHPHVCRSTYASQAIMSGVPLRTVSELLGHETTTVSERYYISTDIKSKATELSAFAKFTANILHT